jgi:ketosteroid isomerase-like protein
MEDVHVTSSTSAQTTGRAANQERMAQQFARRPDTIYVRTPSAIEVFAPWAVASERGEWTGRWTEPDGVMEIGGTYLVQWRRIDGRWLIQSELYVPTLQRQRVLLSPAVTHGRPSSLTDLPCSRTWCRYSRA